MVRRVIAFLLILLGIGLLAYPTVRNRYFDYRQQHLLALWDEYQAAKAKLPGSTSQEGISRQAGQTNPSSDSASGKSSSEQQGSAVQFDPALEQYIFENMQGVLTIKKIDLKIPVLKEDTKENLNISVAHVAGTSGPGEVGNYVIAGHRMRAYGRHFNRLHEVTVGDEIVFTGPEGETYKYRVFEVLIVNPEDTWVLLPSGEEKLITLVTCDYSQKPSVRLVVRGKLVEEGEVYAGSD